MVTFKTDSLLSSRSSKLWHCADLRQGRRTHRRSRHSHLVPRRAVRQSRRIDDHRSLRRRSVGEGRNGVPRPSLPSATRRRRDLPHVEDASSRLPRDERRTSLRAHMSSPGRRRWLRQRSRRHVRRQRRSRLRDQHDNRS